MASQLMLFLVLISLTERASSHKFRRVDQCGRYIRLNDPYSSGEAFSNIECMDQCIEDKGCLGVTSCAQDRTMWRTCEKHNNLIGLHDCNNYETNQKCSTWQKLNPCYNGGRFFNNTCVCPLPYKGAGCQFYQPASCPEIAELLREKNQTAGPSKYFLKTSTQKSVEVFCDFQNGSAGIMYIPKYTLLELTPPELKEFVPNKKEFILRKREINGDERETTIKMLLRFHNRPWTITLGIDTTKFDGKPNEKNNTFVFIGGIPRDKILETQYFGFMTDDEQFEQSKSPCTLDNSTNNYFIFYSETPVRDRTNQTRCQDWNDALKSVPKNKLPNEEYFYFVEMHFKCQAYCFHGDFEDTVGMAPGFIFN